MKKKLISAISIIIFAIASGCTNSSPEVIRSNTQSTPPAPPARLNPPNTHHNINGVWSRDLEQNGCSNGIATPSWLARLTYTISDTTGSLEIQYSESQEMALLSSSAAEVIVTIPLVVTHTEGAVTIAQNGQPDFSRAPRFNSATYVAPVIAANITYKEGATPGTLSAHINTDFVCATGTAADPQNGIDGIVHSDNATFILHNLSITLSQ